MRKITILSVVFTSLFFTSCSQKKNLNVAANDLVVKYENRYDQEEELILYGVEQEYDPELKKITLLYLGYKKMGIAEARELLVTAVNGLLKKINQDKKSYPWNYSFSYKNLNLGIALKSGEGQFAPANYVASICLESGKVKYSFFDQHEGRLEELHSESYETAQGLVLAKGLTPGPRKS